MKKSKLLLALAVYFAFLSVANLLGISEALNRDMLFRVQAFVGIIFGLALAVGLFRHDAWTPKVFIVGAALMIVLNWFWLRAHPPEGMFWGTKWLIAVILNLFPGVLLFLRRAWFRSSVEGGLNEVPNA